MKKLLMVLMSFLVFSCVLAKENNTKIINNKNYESIVKNENNIIVYAASWCPHCQKELEDLNKIQGRLKDIKITVIMYPFIYSDNEVFDYEKETLEFINEKKYNFEYYLDKDREILDKLNLKSIPAIGIIKDRKIIKNIDENKIEIKKILEIFENN